MGALRVSLRGCTVKSSSSYQGEVSALVADGGVLVLSLWTPPSYAKAPADMLSRQAGPSGFSPIRRDRPPLRAPVFVKNYAEAWGRSFVGALRVSLRGCTVKSSSSYQGEVSALVADGGVQALRSTLEILQFSAKRR